MTNIETVRAIYEAFGKGEIAVILSHLADDVEWEYGPPVPDVPWLQPRRGRDQVLPFFTALQALEFHQFEPTAIFGDSSTVVSLVDFEATVRATGKRIVEPDEVHIWHFDGARRVSRFRHRADTYQHWTALQTS